MYICMSDSCIDIGEIRLSHLSVSVMSPDGKFFLAS